MQEQTPTAAEMGTVWHLQCSWNYIELARTAPGPSHEALHVCSQRGERSCAAENQMPRAYVGVPHPDMFAGWWNPCCMPSGSQSNFIQIWLFVSQRSQHNLVGCDYCAHKRLNSCTRKSEVLVCHKLSSLVLLTCVFTCKNPGWTWRTG